MSKELDDIHSCSYYCDRPECVKSQRDELREAIAALRSERWIPDCAADVFKEIGKAIAKFPTWPTDPLHTLAVLGEEYGELTKAVLQLTYEPHKTSMDELRTEAIQTAAMSLRFLQSIDTYQFKRGEQHKQELYAAPSPVQSAWTAHGIKREDTCVWVQDSDGPWNTSCGKVFEFTNEGPAENEANFCYHCGGALLPEPYSDALPSRETAKPTYSQEELSAADKRADARHDKLKIDAAEPALSADPIDIKKRIANGYADDITADEIIALCDRALASLTARDEGIEAAAKVCDELAELPGNQYETAQAKLCARSIRAYGKSIRMLKGASHD